jgi:hypothetical protein
MGGVVSTESRMAQIYYDWLCDQSSTVYGQVAFEQRVEYSVSHKPIRLGRYADIIRIKEVTTCPTDDYLMQLEAKATEIGRLVIKPIANMIMEYLKADPVISILYDGLPMKQNSLYLWSNISIGVLNDEHKLVGVTLQAGFLHQNTWRLLHLNSFVYECGKVFNNKIWGINQYV